VTLFDELRALAGKGVRLVEKTMDMKAYYVTAAAIVAFWRAQGLTLEQACGILAQADAESSLKTNAIGDHGLAYGLHQWHPPRRDAIKAGCGIDLGELPPLAAQLQAALWELTHTEQRAFYEIKQAKTAWAAGVAACRYWERPGSQAQWGKRGKKAGEWFKYFSQKPAAPAAKVA